MVGDKPVNYMFPLQLFKLNGGQILRQYIPEVDF